MKLLFVASIIPSLFLMIYIYSKDRIEKEPIWLLIKLFILGILTVAPAAYAEGYAGDFVCRLFPGMTKTVAAFIKAFFVVALIEEGIKYIVLHYFTWDLSDFNCMFDSVVYSVCISLGFATLENIFYVFAHGFMTALMRAVTAVPGHTMFAVFMGVFYGRAKYHSVYGTRIGNFFNKSLALIAPVVVHGFYDFCLFEATKLSVTVFYVFLIVLYIVSYNIVKKNSVSDRYI